MLGLGLGFLVPYEGMKRRFLILFYFFFFECVLYVIDDYHLAKMLYLSILMKVALEPCMGRTEYGK